jgi:hypothetical protein
LGFPFSGEGLIYLGWFLLRARPAIFFHYKAGAPGLSRGGQIESGILAGSGIVDLGLDEILALGIETAQVFFSHFPEV